MMRTPGLGSKRLVIEEFQLSISSTTSVVQESQLCQDLATQKSSKEMVTVSTVHKRMAVVYM